MERSYTKLDTNESLTDLEQLVGLHAIIILFEQKKICDAE